MTTLELTRRLAKNDVRLILRDRMLILLLAMAIVMGLAGRYALPAIDASLAAAGIMPSKFGGVRFATTYPMFVAFICVWQGALLPGTVFGFLLLDEKEDDTLTAMAVTPVPLRRYVGYRVALPALLGFVFSLGLMALMGHAPLSWWQRPLLALGAACTAPIVTLALATFAANKVQGLAYTKFAGVAGLTIIIGWFVAEPFQWLLGLFPPFLVSKSYWLLLEGRSLAWPVLAIALVAQLLIMRWLMRRFRAAAFG